MATSPDLPRWMTSAQEAYRGSDRQSVQTNFLRGDEDIRILEQKVLPPIESPLNVLVVGVGLDAFPFVCSYLPFKLGGYLEHMGVDYTMDLVDKDAQALEDVRRRTVLYMAPDKMLVEDRPVFNASWNRYLEHTGNPEQVLYESSPHIPFHHIVPQPSQDAIIRSGVHMAEIPQGFKRKRASGAISFRHSDIARALLTPGKYDYISCTYVLYLLPPEGQKLAMYSMAKALAPGGMMLINECGGGGQYLTPERKGWMGEAELAQMGLKRDPVDTASSYVQLAYRKAK